MKATSLQTRVVFGSGSHKHFLAVVCSCKASEADSLDNVVAKPTRHITQSWGASDLEGNGCETAFGISEAIQDREDFSS